MGKITILLSLVLPCILFPAVNAQGIESFRRRLQAPDSTLNSRVVAVEHGDAAAAVRSSQMHSPDEKVRGYRVRIFFDNSQNARELSQTAVEKFEELFPEIPVYRVYDNPYFKVTVGNCRTSEEAIALQAKIVGVFDRAFVIREDIPMSLFAE